MVNEGLTPLTPPIPFPGQPGDTPGQDPTTPKGPAEQFEITVDYQPPGEATKSESYVGVKHIGMTQDGFFRLLLADGTMVDYSIQFIVKRTSRVMEVSLV